MVHCDQTQELSRSLLHPHLLRLHEKLRDIKENVETSKREHRALNASFAQTISKHASVLAEIEGKLKEILDNYYTGSKLNYTSVHVQYLRAKVDTVAMKCKTLETEIKRSTYPKENIKAINIVIENLSQRLKERKAELTAMNNKLAQYRNVGPEFSALVEDYAQILKQIEEKKWALKELTGVDP